MSTGGEERVAHKGPRYSALYEIDDPQLLVSPELSKAVEAGRRPALVIMRPHQGQSAAYPRYTLIPETLLALKHWLPALEFERPGRPDPPLTKRGDLLLDFWSANRMQPERKMLYDRARSAKVIRLARNEAGPTEHEGPLSQPLASPPAQPLFDPLSPELIADPYPFYHRLRAEDPVHRSPLGFYVLSRHSDVSSVLRDKRFGKDFVGQATQRHGAQILDEPVYRSMRHWMLTQNPPDHTRLRGLVVQAFTARRVEDMRPRIQQIVDATLDQIAPRGHADLIADFAFRLPVTVICEMLGIPRDDHEMFLTGARQSGRLLDPVSLSRAELDAANAHNSAAAAYFQQLFELRRREPGDDLTSRLVQAEEQGSKLTNEELTANIILLFGAGHETTVNLIGNGLLALHRNPDPLELLRKDPFTPNAIEELLRYDSSVQGTGRTALEDVEVGGTAIEKGEAVLCLLGAANRDPAVYAEPDRLDLTRANIRPLSFGGGIHFCLGAQLARIEAEIAIATLLRRLPNLAIDDPEHPDWRQTFVLRGLIELPASW